MTGPGHTPAPEPMKVRIGYGLGTRTRLHDETYGAVVDALESLEFDSLWLSEKISGEAPDPLVAMAYGAGRTTKLKFGMSVMVLPGRNPVVLAKELATLATMSGGRLLPAFGLGAVDPIEQQAFGVDRTERAALFDETLEVMRKCWTGEAFAHDGARFHYLGVVVRRVVEAALGHCRSLEEPVVGCGRVGGGVVPRHSLAGGAHLPSSSTISASTTSSSSGAEPPAPAEPPAADSSAAACW